MEAGVPIGAQLRPDPDDLPAEATVLRMLLGAQLRRLREAAGISPEQAGYRDPGVAVQDQPDGDRPGRVQDPRRRRTCSACTA